MLVVDDWAVLWLYPMHRGCCLKSKVYVNRNGPGLIY